MFNATEIVIDAFVERLQEKYQRVYGLLEPEYSSILAFVEDPDGYKIEVAQTDDKWLERIRS